MPLPQEEEKKSDVVEDIFSTEEQPELKPEKTGRVELEKGIEIKKEQEIKPEIQPSEKEEVHEKPATAPPAKVTVKTPIKSEIVIQVEKILEENLREAFAHMDEQTKKRFKYKGEEVAGKIEKLLLATRVQVKRIFKLIKDWLKIIPGVNKYFLEQEAKIKTDKIMAIKRQK